MQFPALTAGGRSVISRLSYLLCIFLLRTCIECIFPLVESPFRKLTKECRHPRNLQLRMHIVRSSEFLLRFRDTKSEHSQSVHGQTEPEQTFLCGCMNRCMFTF